MSFALAALFYALAYTVKAQPVAGTATTETGAKTISVSELRNHDSAFSLLLETYRQFQNKLIQIDYSNRLSAAMCLADVTTRKQTVALVRRERDLRIRRLTAQLVVFSVMYDHSRQFDKQKVDNPSGAGMDRKGAARELQNFVVITPAADAPQGAEPFQTLPSSAVLLNQCPDP
jgi:hypothetical protein